MAGVGGVRATLPDMVRYVESELGTRESEIAPALAQTQQQVARIGGHTMGMNWEILSTANIANGHTIIMHGGGTGGCSSFVAFDRAAKRAAVLLSDTALTNLGGLVTLGLHLLDPSVSAGAPRMVATADAKLIDALVGRYRLQGGLGMDLRHKGDALTTKPTVSPNSKWATTARAISIRSSSTRCSVRSAKLTAHTPSLCFTVAARSRPSASAHPRRSLPNGRRPTLSLTRTTATIRFRPPLRYASSPAAPSSSCRAPVEGRAKSHPSIRISSSPRASAPSSTSSATPTAK